MKISVIDIESFIGCHLTKKLIEGAYRVVKIDYINDYYDVNL